MSRKVEALRRVVLAGAALSVDDDQPTFWDRVDAGRWEPGTLAALDALVGPQTLFLDLGAWIGPLSMLAAVRGARVIAVEADPAARDQLRRNLDANPALAPRIEVVAAAVSPDAEPVRLGARRKAGDSMSSVLLAGNDASWTSPAVTPAALADVVAQVAGAADARRLVIKIDIEGGEYALLPHLGPLFAGREVAVLASFHPAILSEAGEAEPERRLREAVSILEGWDAAPVTAVGLGPGLPLRPAAFDLGDFDVWLFRKPPAASLGPPAPSR